MFRLLLWVGIRIKGPCWGWALLLLEYLKGQHPQRPYGGGFPQRCCPACSDPEWSLHPVQSLSTSNGPDGGNVSSVWRGTTCSRALADRVPRDCSSSTRHLWQREPITQCSHGGTEEGVADVSAYLVGPPCQQSASVNNDNNNSRGGQTDRQTDGKTNG